MDNKRYEFKFVSGALKDNEVSGVQQQKYKFNKGIEELNGIAEKLDRIDEFSSLQIAVPKYLKKENSDYGIELIDSIHKTGDVILPHQEKSASEFLKELRGFGLLADVVGSGKTYEAGIVLSELAARNKLKSMLVIVPEQVYAKWKFVLEEQFGMGKGVFNEVEGKLKGNIERLKDDSRRPARPILVKDKDFATWDESVSALLFDVIVVDEAHNLCQESGEYAKAMKLLSLLMETKKAAGSTYCLLLSATPHSGNLDNMFRLWYFIRCKGGNPSDFDEKEDRERTEKYRKEKKYYKEVVCHDSITVMDFIKNVKIEMIENYHSEKFAEYLKKLKLTRESYNRLIKVEKQRITNGFMESEIALANDGQIRNDVLRRVASAYHNGVLRTIMIRRKTEKYNVCPRNVINYFYYPTKKDFGVIDIVDFNGEDITVDCQKLYTNQAICKMVKGKAEYYSLQEYCNDFRNDQSYRTAYAKLIKNILVKIDDPDKSGLHKKKNSIKYYSDVLSRFPEKINLMVKPYKYINDESIDHKYNDLADILNNHSESRVIIFFDYENKNNIPNLLAEKLLNDNRFRSRLLIADKELGHLDQIVEAYNANSNAILLCKDSAFTEGANLQEGNVLVNFEVTPDPLAMNQKIGRIARLGQKSDVYIYSLADMNNLEGYGLAYLSTIGILSSNDSDATIISGSSNEKMVAIRCSHCKYVKMVSLEEYTHAKKLPIDHKDRIDLLYCRKTKACEALGKIKYKVGYQEVSCTEMSEITIHNYKCDSCQSTFTRSLKEDGYLCMARNNDFNSVMGTDFRVINGKSTRKFHCRKICAVAHCSRFTTGALAGKCLALKAYNEDKSIPLASIKKLCLQKCEYKNSCNEICRPYNIGLESVEHCINCKLGGKISCSTGAHILEFNDLWEAKCPVCAVQKGPKRKGNLVEIVDSTFDKFIRGSWNFDGDNGESFVDTLLKEVERVEEIRQVLETDEER